MHIANVLYVVYGTTLVRAKNKMSKTENQDRKKEKEKMIFFAPCLSHFSLCFWFCLALKTDYGCS